jgi:hypothetical protein
MFPRERRGLVHLKQRQKRNVPRRREKGEALDWNPQPTEEWDIRSQKQIKDLSAKFMQPAK